MSCYRPFLGIPADHVNPSGKRSIKILGRYSPEAKYSDPRSIAIPCGKCIGCRLNQSRQWADRMILELDHTGKGVFLTLTYNDVALYENGKDRFRIVEDESTGEFLGCLPNLCKRDFQLFMKSLRERFEGREIRYYAAGEYGSTTKRCHWHAIIFGLSLSDFKDVRPFKYNELGQMTYISDWLSNEVWKNGFCALSDVSWKTCAYTARYVQKKVYASDEVYYEKYGLTPECSLMSRRPGIGAYYLEDHPDALNYDTQFLSAQNDSVEVRLPKYIFEKAVNKGLISEESYAKIKEDRKLFANDNLLLKLQQTDLSFIDQLVLEEANHLSSITSLKRPLE